MPIESALYSRLTGYSSLATLVSTRIYPNAIPQNATFPAIAYQVISTDRNYRHAGQSNNALPRIQITVEAASYSSVVAVCAAVRAALSGYKGTVGTVVIGGIFLETEYDGYNLDTDTTVRRQDYTIEWKEV